MAESRLTFSADHDACGVGFIAQLGGPASHARGRTRAGGVSSRLAHRGGVDADGRSGDGAGLLVALPKAFFRRVAREDGIELPDEFGVGMVFLQRGREDQAVDAIRVCRREIRPRVSGLACQYRPILRSWDHARAIPCR